MRSIIIIALILMALTLENLNERLTALENKQVSLPYPLSYNDQEILRKWLNDGGLSSVLFDVNWDDYFYYRTSFEGTPGDTVTCTPGSGTLCPSSGINADGLVLTTEAALANDFADFEKSPLADSGLAWDKPQKMRLGFRVPFITSQEIYMMRGSYNFASPQFGFKLTDASLQGFVNDGSTETTVTIQNISADTSYILEARYFPNDKIIFYVDGVETKILTTGLPNPIQTIGNRRPFYNFHVKNTSTAIRTLIIAFFEYIQLK